MSKPTSGAAPPFCHEIRVAWGDCDPARIAYTARIPAWALAAIDAWWAEVIGIDWYALNLDRGFGTPFVHMEMDFRAPVTPRHRLICEVRLLGLGRSSIRHQVVGRQDGTVRFGGRFVSALVDAHAFRPCPPPEDLRARLQAALG